MKTRAARKREREEQPIQPPQSFTILPLDVWEIIVRWGGLQTYVMVTRTCRHLNGLWKRAEIQKRLLRFFTVVIRDPTEIDKILEDYYEYYYSTGGCSDSLCVIGPKIDHLYTVNKKPHRDDDLPVYDDKGIAIWGFQGHIHRGNDLPAVVWKKCDFKVWFQNGKIHRENDKPAMKSSLTCEKWWFFNGELHRGSGNPAMVCTGFGNWKKEWWIHGRFIKSEPL